MRVDVNICYSGNGRVQARLTTQPCGRIYMMNLPEESWCRGAAARALDLLVVETGLPRRLIRFRHR